VVVSAPRPLISAGFTASAAARSWWTGTHGRAEPLAADVRDEAQVAAAPEYKEDAPIVVLGASGSLQPLQAIQ